MLVDLVIEDDRWDEDALAALSDRAARAALAHLGHDAKAFEIALLACDDARIATLNAEFRGKAGATNVLSWPTWDLSADEDGAPPDPPEPGTPDAPEPLGDIALAHDTCLREAVEQGKSLEAHLTHLIVHATLHLLGFDHIRDKDAALMEKTETEILAQLGVADPYETGAEMSL
ncbi:MAG: rRNA maturation RNase YbeY [Rhodobacteraceae bacterium]|nr:MAG: rRNA maturation RNase YbeY [Paracoccaceae bacterium]